MALGQKDATPRDHRWLDRFFLQWNWNFWGSLCIFDPQPPKTKVKTTMNLVTVKHKPKPQTQNHKTQNHKPKTKTQNHKPKTKAKAKPKRSGLKSSTLGSTVKAKLPPPSMAPAPEPMKILKRRKHSHRGLSSFFFGGTFFGRVAFLVVFSF